jgi:hypothetical protein
MNKKDLKGLHAQLKEQLNKLVAYFQMEKVGVPDRIKEKASGILKSESLDQARIIFKKTLDSMELEGLARWGRGEILGPLTPNNLEAQATRARGLYNLHRKKGNDKVAQQQLEKSERLRKQAHDIRVQKSKGTE